MNTRELSILLLGYAALLVAGGWIGFIKAKSKPSLIAGHVSGLIIVIAIFLMKTDGPASRFGGLLAFFTALALTLFFGKRFAKTRKMMPAGMMAIVSALVSLLLLAGGSLSS